jgi:hypothetical protein
MITGRNFHLHVTQIQVLIVVAPVFGVLLFLVLIWHAGNAGGVFSSSSSFWKYSRLRLVRFGRSAFLQITFELHVLSK